MRPVQVLSALLITALVATVAAAEGWFGDTIVLALLASLAMAVVAFNWWELWSHRHDR